ncbi:PTS sugar transporter subunit IIA domain-containing protein, partial [Klebsiella pneumoniae]
ADLFGGTPCNFLSNNIMQVASFDLYTGMNLPMVISYVNASLLAIEGDYVKESAESIVKVNELLLNVAVDDEDE